MDKNKKKIVSLVLNVSHVGFSLRPLSGFVLRSLVLLLLLFPPFLLVLLRRCRSPPSPPPHPLFS